MNTILARHDMAIHHDMIMYTFLYTLVATFILISTLIIWSFHGRIIPVVINISVYPCQNGERIFSPYDSQ